MNPFETELRELIDRYQDLPGTALEEIVDALEAEAERLVERVNERVS